MRHIVLAYVFSVVGLIKFGARVYLGAQVLKTGVVLADLPGVYTSELL